jgi:hypothetical protein
MIPLELNLSLSAGVKELSFIDLKPESITMRMGVGGSTLNLGHYPGSGFVAGNHKEAMIRQLK